MQKDESKTHAKRPAYKKRLNLSRHYAFMEPYKWKTVVFSDEKQFCLDGPNGQACFWGDKRLPPDIFSKRAHGGGGVMVWAAISYEVNRSWWS